MPDALHDYLVLCVHHHVHLHATHLMLTQPHHSHLHAFDDLLVVGVHPLHLRHGIFQLGTQVIHLALQFEDNPCSFSMYSALSCSEALQGGGGDEWGDGWQRWLGEVGQRRVSELHHPDGSSLA